MLWTPRHSPIRSRQSRGFFWFENQKKIFEMVGVIGGESVRGVGVYIMLSVVFLQQRMPFSP